MKRFAPLSSLVMVFSLFLVFAIWLTPAFAANAAPKLTSLGQLRADGQLGAPAAMDLDQAGNLYVADASMRKIFSFDRYGKLTRVYSDAAFKFADNRGLTSGRGLAVTPDGKRLYFARDNQALILDTATGAVVGELKGSGDAPEFKLTAEIDLDADGNVYVADAGPGRMTVKIYSKDGQFLKKFGGVGTATGLFQAISSMTIDSAGRVFVADPSPSSLGGKVNVFTIDPLTLTVATQTSLNKSTQFGNGPVESPANSGTYKLLASELHTPKGIAFDDLGRGYFLEYMFSDMRILDSAANNFTYLTTYWNTGFNQGQLAYVADAVFDPATKRLYISCDGGRIEIFGIDSYTIPDPPAANTAPTAPKAQSPVGGSVVATATPVLTFSGATDDKDVAQLKYQVVVKQDGAEVFKSDWVSVLSVTVPAGKLTENGSFTWAVQAVDVEGLTSGFGDAAAFVVNAVDEAPTAPELTSPQTGAVLGADGQIIWGASSDPDPNDAVSQYRVEVATDAAFNDVVLTAQLDATSIGLGDFAGYADLVVGGSYFCRVTALDLNKTASVPSAAVEFVYDTSVLTVNAGLSGSAVFLSGNLAYPGRPVGVTPLELRDLAPGNYQVSVEAPGFEPYLVRVDMTLQGKQEVYAKLQPAQKPQDFKGAKAFNGRTGLKVSSAAAPFAIDFDGDGTIDLLTGDGGGAFSLFTGLAVDTNGDPSVGTGRAPSLPVLPGAVPFVADWNNDDREDLIVGLADGTVKLLLNVGTDLAPAYAAPQDLVAAVASGAAPVVVDLNQDGRKDLVVGYASGQVVVFRNQAGTDEAPILADPVNLFNVGAAVVPSAVDWNADGRRDLIVASANGISVYINENGAFTPVSLSATPAKAVFAVDADGDKGKDLVLGVEDGRLLLAAAASAVYPAAYQNALLGKLAEVEELIGKAGLNFASDIATIRGQIVDGAYAGAGVQAQKLADALVADAAAQASAGELAALCPKDLPTNSNGGGNTPGSNSGKDSKQGTDTTQTTTTDTTQTTSQGGKSSKQ